MSTVEPQPTSGHERNAPDGNAPDGNAPDQAAPRPDAPEFGPESLADLPSDDRFIPIRYSALVDAVLKRRVDDPQQRDALQQIAALIREVTDQEAGTLQHALLDEYAPLNPDRDTVPQQPLDQLRTKDAYAQFDRSMTYLLDKANFERMTDVVLEEAVAAANSAGLRVRLDPQRVASLAIWVRGHARVTHTRRDWTTRFRGREVSLPVYRRFATLVRLNDEPFVRLKLFKDIPIQDVEALLPHAEVHMTLFDQLKLYGGGIGALGTTIYKVFTAILAGGVALLQLSWLILSGLVILAIRTVTGYRTTRLKRDAQRTSHLYLQNLANNAAVIHSLLTMIREEEAKEAFLAYVYCLQSESPDVPMTEIDRRIENDLNQDFGVTLNFDITDGFETLQRLGLRTPGSACGVIQPDAARNQLQQLLASGATRDYHLSANR